MIKQKIIRYETLEELARLEKFVVELTSEQVAIMNKIIVLNDIKDETAKYKLRKKVHAIQDKLDIVVIARKKLMNIFNKNIQSMSISEAFQIKV